VIEAGGVVLEMKYENRQPDTLL